MWDIGTRVILSNMYFVKVCIMNGNCDLTMKNDNENKFIVQVEQQLHWTYHP